MAGLSPAVTPKATPKRKRDEQHPVTPIKFSFNPLRADSPNDGDNSPQSNVAHRFRGLALGSGGGDVDDHAPPIGTEPDLTRKRRKPDQDMPDLAPLEEQRRIPNPAANTTLDAPIAPEVTLGANPARSVPEIDVPPDSTSLRRRRAGTPPLRLKKSPAKVNDKDCIQDATIADPVRAALTWHEDEITIYDPDDEDDDGTGINGVGFKPTPAIAHARAMKRRQQMADYRKREENEARAKRSQRRRGEASAPSGGIVKKRSPSRRVRFIDAENQKIAVTTN
ncbi:hypothetical protein HIM_02784 [Hirsutella minnesotensis 3608]|nr:hypothetical protein HIM_02784 [Hirsutella minnesotensis 3608]